jgi:hypothetical protein
MNGVRAWLAAPCCSVHMAGAQIKQATHHTQLLWFAGQSRVHPFPFTGQPGLIERPDAASHSGNRPGPCAVAAAASTAILACGVLRRVPAHLSGLVPALSKVELRLCCCCPSHTVLSCRVPILSGKQKQRQATVLTTATAAALSTAIRTLCTRKSCC